MMLVHRVDEIENMHVVSVCNVDDFPYQTPNAALTLSQCVVVWQKKSPFSAIIPTN